MSERQGVRGRLGAHFKGFKELRSRFFHFSLPTGLKSGRSERISADPLDIYGPVGDRILGRFFIKFDPIFFMSSNQFYQKHKIALTLTV